MTGARGRKREEKSRTRLRDGEVFYPGWATSGICSAWFPYFRRRLESLAGVRAGEEGDINTQASVISWGETITKMGQDDGWCSFAQSKDLRLDWI